MPVREESGINHKAKSGIEEIRDVAEDWGREKAERDVGPGAEGGRG